MIVTDARFHEQDHKIHIKLRCGVLQNGTIDPYTLRWTEDNERFSEIKPREYVVLSSKLKSFNLDDVVVPNGVLVTGAGFKVVDDHFISLVVKGNNINNYNHGNTFGADDLYSAPKSGKPRKGIDLSFIERPPRIMGQTHEMSKAGENYINLTLSKWSDEYNNEAIVPYFDMTPYGPKYGLPSAVTPLGGLGLFYKSLPGYTGFLAFKHLSPMYVYYVDNEETLKSSLKTAEEPNNEWDYR
ncbi:uncharacterized protein LOC123267258 [Cotesia glomerata]|uniref:uncharacterized protein LOC123267258 n=1 Tax=Cotesia glomerata TaxID=32391 RepID=UPI001D012003|nr:uncharacterized protein LOC123267258 [Cotesia glomerata]